MTNLEDKEIKEQVYMEMLKNGKGESVIRKIDEINRRISRVVRKSSYVGSKGRYNDLMREIKGIVNGIGKEIEKEYEIAELISYEIEKQVEILEKELGVKIETPKVNQIASAVRFRPILKDMTFQSYLEKIESGLYDIWDAQVRAGYISGINTKQIVRNVLGEMDSLGKLKESGMINSFRNSVYYNTLTALQMIANESREQVFRKNEKYFTGENGYKYEALATLDKRTCLVCGKLDKTLYKTYSECPKYPLHRSCRCLIIPYTKSLGLRASMGGQYEDVSYSVWFGRQNSELQKDILGNARYKMYKSGKYDIQDFSSNSKVYTLSELRKKVGNADNI